MYQNNVYFLLLSDIISFPFHFLIMSLVTSHKKSNFQPHDLCFEVWFKQSFLICMPQRYSPIFSLIISFIILPFLFIWYIIFYRTVKQFVFFQCKEISRLIYEATSIIISRWTTYEDYLWAFIPLVYFSILMLAPNSFLQLCSKV